MKHVNALLVTLAISSLLIGCGSDSTNSTLVNPTGSNSLFIDADVSGSDQGNGLFQTTYSVVLQDSLGAIVIDAVVTMTNASVGVLTLVHDTTNPGTYDLSRSGYTSGTYILNITRDSDFVANVAVVAPDLHVITFPTVSDTLMSDVSFTALWTRSVVAVVVTLETRDYGPTLSSSIGDTDDGSFIVPSGGTVRDDQRVRIWRKNSTSISVAWTGSTFDAEIRNSVSPIVVVQ